MVPSIGTCIFGPIYLDPSICIRPVYLDPFIGTCNSCLHVVAKSSQMCPKRPKETAIPNNQVQIDRSKSTGPIKEVQINAFK